VCWTQAPEDLATLRSQRARWQRGLLETLSRHRRGFFARGSGVIGWLALPSFALFEAATPVIEVVGAALMGLAWIVGALSWSGFASIVLAVAAFGILLSASSMLLEETHFRLYAKKRHLLVLMVTLVIENLGFRQLVSWWRLQGTWTWMRGRPQAWGNMVRKQLGT
jgi:cellulose synthase/poly-beta-1,6-N-acetylglucosamine synthase-like glycosyltransferase